MHTNILDVGVNLNHWFPVGRSTDFRSDRLTACSIWPRQLVLFRDSAGTVHALEDRCLHRKVALSAGEIDNCRVVCPYHGWAYDVDGRLAHVPSLQRDQIATQSRIPKYAVRETRGLVWVFPGSASHESSAPFDRPACDDNRWITVPLDRVFNNHFSIGITNGMDFSHFHLHRKYQPWSQIRVVGLKSDENSVTGEYEIITTARGVVPAVYKYITGRRADNEVKQQLRVTYSYPHHLVEVDDVLRIWVGFQPVHESKVRVYIEMQFKAPSWQQAFRRLYFFAFGPFLRRIQEQDAWIGLQEHRANVLHPSIKRMEINPIVHAVEELLERKWSLYQRMENVGLSAPEEHAVGSQGMNAVLRSCSQRGAVSTV